MSVDRCITSFLWYIYSSWPLFETFFPVHGALSIQQIIPWGLCSCSLSDVFLCLGMRQGLGIISHQIRSHIIVAVFPGVLMSLVSERENRSNTFEGIGLPKSSKEEGKVLKYTKGQVPSWLVTIFLKIAFGCYAVQCCFPNRTKYFIPQRVHGVWHPQAYYGSVSMCFKKIRNLLPIKK